MPRRRSRGLALLAMTGPSALASAIVASALGCAPPAGEPPAATAPVPEDRLASAESVAAGRALFERHCTPCHGARADGGGPRAANLASAPADLTALPSERRDPRRLFALLHAGVPGTDMPSWRALDDEQLWDLVAYLRALPSSGESAPAEAAP